MRPSAMSRSMAWRATSRRYGSKLERMIAPGVSSTIETDAGRLLERADVPPLAPDDPPLHVVARQIHDRHGGLDGVLGGAALDGLGDDLSRAGGRVLARLGLEALDERGRVAARVGLDLLQQEIASLVGGEAGDPLQLPLLLGDEPLVAARGAGGGLFAALDVALAAAQILLEAVGGREPVGEPLRLLGERLLGAHGGLGALPGLAFGLDDRNRAPFPWPRAAPPCAAPRRRAPSHAGGGWLPARRGRPSRRRAGGGWRASRRRPHRQRRG